ncbi:MAG: hypothetical protein ABSB33_05070 [Tepidisphaeraceae bacterium]|jgi:hypothetical protein
MAVVDRAMLAGAFSLIAAGTAAAVHGRITVDLLQQWVAAIRDPATDDAKRAALADRGAVLPFGMHPQRADAAEAGGGKFADGFQEKARHSGRGC